MNINVTPYVVEGGDFVAQEFIYVFNPNRLARLMAQRSLKFKELASRAQVRPSSILSWSRGESDPRLSNYLDVCAALKIHPMALIEKLERGSGDGQSAAQGTP